MPQGALRAAGQLLVTLSGRGWQRQWLQWCLQQEGRVRHLKDLSLADLRGPQVSDCGGGEQGLLQDQPCTLWVHQGACC